MSKTAVADPPLTANDVLAIKKALVYLLDRPVQHAISPEEKTLIEELKAALR